MNTYDLAERLMEKKEARTRVGWVDWSENSWDRMEAMVRAWRIFCRLSGVRTNRRGDEV